MTLQVVNLGLPKTGTTTLARALRRAGLATVDHKVRKKQATTAAPAGAFVADLMYQGYFNTGDPGHLFDRFTAISEMSVLSADRSLWPQTDFGIIDALRAHHPGLKFVATWREPFAVSQSMLAWNTLGTTRLPKANVPGLPAGFGETTAERVRWITAHYTHLDALFAGDAAYLRIDVAAEDAAERLSEFLGRPVPWWGRSNRNPDNVVA